MEKLNKNTVRYVLILVFGIFSGYLHADESSPFLKFDNNLIAGLDQIVSAGNYKASSLELNGQVLFNNNVWVNLNAATKLTFSLVNNNNQNISKLYNNSAASSYSLEGGYAFLIDNQFNLIPHVGFAYGNQLIAANENSVQQFIIEDPSFNWSLGLKSEYIIIPSRLKFGFDTAFNYATHKAVLPNNSSGSLGHEDFTNYSFLLTPELQWDITDRLIFLVYDQLNFTFGGDANFDGANFSQVGVNSSQMVVNNYFQNTVGLGFGFAF